MSYTQSNSMYPTVMEREDWGTHVKTKPWTPPKTCWVDGISMSIAGAAVIAHTTVTMMMEYYDKYGKEAYKEYVSAREVLPTVSTETKKCCTCHHEKDISLFNKSKAGRVTSNCSGCLEQKRDWHRRNKHSYPKGHRIKCKKCGVEKAPWKFYLKDNGKVVMLTCKVCDAKIKGKKKK